MTQVTPIRTPAPPSPTPRGLRAMFTVRPTPRQWPVALRTAVCVVVPALVGLWAGNLTGGLLASLGGFASLYGSGRPYLNRARLLTVVAVVQAVAVALGIWASAWPWAGVLTVTAIAVAATVFCNAFNVQPGAYQIALSCATGTALHARGADPVQSGLLVLAGGLFACVVHLSEALVDRYAPERGAVSAAATAVAKYIEGIQREEADELQHEAAVAMHGAWIALVNQQPHRSKPPHGLLRLRETSRTLQLLLSDAMRRRQPDPAAAARARRLGAQARRGSGPRTGQLLYALPLGRPSASSLLRNTVAPGSRSLLVVIRVAVASAAAGAIGAALGLSHTYWAVAVTVLILSQGFDQRRTTQRGLERTAGTFVGLGLAALAMAAQPSGLLLVAMIAVMVFCTQLLVQRNYAAAAVFITGSAMLMTGGQQQSAAEMAALLQARGLDTAIGCFVAVVVFGLLSKKSPSGWLPIAMADTLYAAAAAVDQFTPATVTSWPALTARRDLQRRVIRLSEAYENGVNGFPRQRVESERVWPVVVAIERLAYRVLAEGWRLEEVAGQRGLNHRQIAEVEPPSSEGLRVLAEAIRRGRRPGRTDQVPLFLSRDVGDLRRVLQR